MPALHWQQSLFDSDEALGIDPALTGLLRRQLDPRSWIDQLPGWVRGGGVLMEELLRRAPWLPQRRRHLYEREVDEPRLIAPYDDLSALPPMVEAMRRVLSERYRVEFDSVLVNLYRDGRDGVAWHGDTMRKMMTDPLVVTVSLGSRRRFLLRPVAGGTAVRLDLANGDLLVMGGACQHEWQHTVPKAPRETGARISITMRHSRPVAA